MLKVTITTPKVSRSNVGRYHGKVLLGSQWGGRGGLGEAVGPGGGCQMVVSRPQFGRIDSRKPADFPFVVLWA